MKDKSFSNINIRKLARHVRKAQEGDKKSLDYIVSKTSGYVYYYALSLLGDDSKAQDAVQEIYLIVIRKLLTLKYPKSFLSWLKIITAHYCSNLLKKEEEIDILTDFIEDTDIQINPEKYVEMKEISERIQSAVYKLPVAQKECVLMYYFEELSVKEIADTLGIKEGTVKSRLYTARQTLKRELEKHEDNHGIPLMSCISYSLIKEAQKTSIEIPVSFSVSVSAKVVSGIPILAHMQAAASASIPTAIKVAAVALAGTVSLGGAVTYAVVSSAPNTDSAASSYTSVYQNSGSTSGSVGYVESQDIPKITEDQREELFYQYGFTDNDKRTEILLENKRNLDSENTKAYLYDRMCNSIDYFDTVKATYYCLDNSLIPYYVTYAIRKNDIEIQALDLYFNEAGEFVSGDFYDGHYIENFQGEAENIATDSIKDQSNQDDAIARKIAGFRNDGSLLTKYTGNPYMGKSYQDYTSIRSLDFSSLIDSRNRIREENITGELEPVYYPRTNLCCVFGSEQYFPQNTAMGYLHDFENWRIKEITTLLGRECYVISGETHDDYSIKTDTVNYEMWVDGKTGVLLQMRCYNESGSLSHQLYTYEYEVNTEISDNIFAYAE